MALITELYKHIRKVDDPSIDRSMAAALPTADDRAAELIGLMLLERRHPAGMLALIQQFDRVGSSVQEQIVDRVDELYRPLREATHSRDARGRANVIRIIRQAQAAKLAYLIVQLLRAGGSVGDDAAACLLELAQGVATRSDDIKPHADAATAKLYQKAVEDGLESFSAHQHPASLVALAMMAPRPFQHAHQLLGNVRQSAVEPLRRMLEDAKHPAMRRASLWMMQIPTLQDAAAAGIRRSFDQSLGYECLLLSHLTLDATVRHGLMKLRNTEPWPRHEQLDAMPPQQLRHYPQWITALPLTCTQKVQRLAAMDAVTDAHARLLALRRLMSLARNEQAVGVDVRIADFCHDADPQIARIALRWLIADHYPELPALLLRLVNSPHPEIRALAAEELAPLGFERLWSAWSNMTPARRLTAARALIKIDPNFHRQIAAKLSKPEQSSRLRALTIIHMLNQGSFFEETLEALAADPNARIASAAVRALGSASGDRAREALNKALQHSDPRVRANAIEAMHELNIAGNEDALQAMAAHEASRPRANAIAVLLDSDVNSAFDALQRMLADTRSDQRTSALWLVDHMALTDVARHVAEMSISDPDPKVRQRAMEVIQRLIASLEGSTNNNSKQPEGAA